MNKWAKRKWIRALKSGEYEKTTGTLCRIDSEGRRYCCLGVFVEEMTPEFAHEKNGRMEVDELGNYIPNDLSKMYGLSQGAQDTLARLNDQSTTFDLVIAYIEDNL